MLFDPTWVWMVALLVCGLLGMYSAKSRKVRVALVGRAAGRSRQAQPQSFPLSLQHS